MYDLPAEITSFVGRQDEVAAASRLLSTDRLVTLTGPGGVGKTRLALRVARLSQDQFRDGVCLVRLDTLRDSALLGSTVLAALGLHDKTVDATTQVLAYLRNKELLLILDNCEHLGDAAGLFATEVLSSSANVRILATSRHTLGVPGESLMAVDPIAVRGIHVVRPDDRGDAITLFEDRAKAVLHGFEVDRDNHELVARICTRLDGIPLAIELAAMWLRTLPLESLVDRLDDRFGLLGRGRRTTPPRHRTLSAAVGWSYDLCSPSEARLWAWLSVFEGGFTLDVAEEVCSFPDDRENVLDLVAGLVDKSVLILEGDRYRMLETLREYGSHELTRSGEETVARQRHLDYVTRLTERAAQELTRRESQVATLVAEGATNKAVASELRISRRTVETHVDHILTKLGFSSRTQIAVWVAGHRYRPA